MIHYKELLRLCGIVTFFMLFTNFPLVAQSQSQSGFSYQAVARDDMGNPLDSKDLTVRISIHIGSGEGTLIWQEHHDVTTSKLGLFTLTVGGPTGYDYSGSVNRFDDIDWSANQYFMNVMVKKDAEFLDMGGSIIQTVPVAQFAKSAKSSSGTFSVQAETPGIDKESLFEVRRSDGSVAFAVCEEMVWVNPKTDGSKGVKGGFAIGGYNTDTKGPNKELLWITPDSIRMNINQVNSKGIKGGFAIGGYNTDTKDLNDPYMYISSKSVEDYSIALGVGADASGPYATAIGYQSIAASNNSLALGHSAQSIQGNATAIGYSAYSDGENATAIGYQSQAKGERAIAIGSYINYTYDLLPVFSNIGKKGDSKGDFIILPPIIAPNLIKVSFNRANTAEGDYSISFGNGNLSQNGGMALGTNNNAIEFGAVGLGVSNKANSICALAAGYGSEASGYYATAIGNNASATAYGSFVIGQYNETFGNSLEWILTDPLFIVGNGLNSDNRNNALTIYKNGRSIFKGSDANLTLNDRRFFKYIDPFTGQLITSLHVYGVRSYVNRADPDVNVYYTGYFFDTGSEGTYNGFYADLRSGDGADVAEYIFDTEGNAEAGDVLIADPKKKESVLISSEPYQSSVIGVVSTDPHLVMNMHIVVEESSGAPIEGVNATRLALTGRVPCKVTDENGPIQPGDLVTTSSIPGHAMKWTPIDVNKAGNFEELKKILAENERRNHAVIGKALEAHESGTGKIMVLISVR